VIVAGVDLSLTATGVALLRSRWECVKVKTRGSQRLREIRDQLLIILNDAGIDFVALEGYSFGSKARGEWLGELGGVVRVELDEHDIAWTAIPPASVKKYATGRGNATKADMRVELLKRANLDIRDDNVVDAWWLRAMALDHFGQPVVKMPETHRVALEKVEWP
jgi:Holliday junction resolvasome RuvABC endonuclease subunit